jgi:hypothetical protein
MTDRRSIFTASLFDSDLPQTWKLVSAGYVLNGTQYGLSEQNVGKPTRSQCLGQSGRVADVGKLDCGFNLDTA